MANEGLGNFEELVMLGVLRLGDEAYGMAVRRELEKVAGREASIGAVYATLDRLEAKGLVESHRGRSIGAKKLLAITQLGRRALSETRATRDRLWEGVSISPAELTSY